MAQKKVDVLFDKIEMVEKKCLIDADQNKFNLERLILRVKCVESELQSLEEKLHIKDVIIQELKLQLKELTKEDYNSYPESSTYEESSPTPVPEPTPYVWDSEGNRTEKG